MIRSGIRRMSDRRLAQTSFYNYQIKRFLQEHPYCQVWLAENSVSEEDAKRQGGRVRLGSPDSPLVSIPLATEVHHKNKRRDEDLLEQKYWMAVSRDGHEKIENNKAWSRSGGFLLPF
jgi:hypothetical protein